MSKRGIESRDLLKLRLIGDVDVSPDGHQVVAVVQEVNEKENTYKRTLHLWRQGDELRPFTSGENDTHPRFSPDGSWIGFISKRSGQPQLWRIPVHGGEAQQVTRIEGGISDFAVSPDGRRIAVLASLDAKGVQAEKSEKEKEKELEEDLYRKFTKDVKVIEHLYHKLDGEGFYRDRAPQVVVVNADGSEPRQLTELPYRYEGLAWSPDGREIYTAVNREPDFDQHPDRKHVWAIPVDGGGPRRLSPLEFWAANPNPSPDGTRIAFMANDSRELGYDTTKLYVVDRDGQGLQCLTADLDRTMGNAVVTDMVGPARGDLQWTPDGRALYLLSSASGFTEVLRVDAESGRAEVAAGSGRAVHSFRLDAAGRVLAYAGATLEGPGELYLVEDGREERLSTLNDAFFREVAVSVPVRFEARAEGGPPVECWAVAPLPGGRPMEPGRKAPAILEIHGGPMAMYSPAYFFEFQLLAAQGWGVVFTNPRGSQGYGEAFCKAIRDRWGEKDAADVMAGLDEAIRRFDWIDPERLGVTGGSYGGYMTNWIVGHTDRFKAAVSGRSVAEWRTMIGTSDFGWTEVERAGGVYPWGRDDEWYRQQSPITYAENVSTPLLIEHQEGDLRCPINQGEAFFTAVKATGKAPVRFVRYPDEFHGMSRTGKPWHRVHRLDEIVRWLGRYLEGREEKAPEQGEQRAEAAS
ncbi:S9 family peptidase [Limnochorda pilosa]|uniref:Acylaminoacyl-peptidase n=1 Tax=Limnochorda pilosa TaxID=1555112 RepID=A0A0K2SJ69_LIMPI|nr:S9 family peptidase [Limnochorda pilosa]BAS26889.1 acylaminoacyl-peptidase [Limnochorda pilosa]